MSDAEDSSQVDLNVSTKKGSRKSSRPTNTKEKTKAQTLGRESSFDTDSFDNAQEEELFKKFRVLMKKEFQKELKKERDKWQQSVGTIIDEKLTVMRRSIVDEVLIALKSNAKDDEKDQWNNDVQRVSNEIREKISQDKNLRNAIRDAVAALRIPATATSLDDGRHAVRILFEKGSSVVALSPSAPLKEAEQVVRNKFQIGDDDLEWSTPEGTPLDPNAALAFQLRENDWIKPGGVELVLARVDHRNRKRSLKRTLTHTKESLQSATSSSRPGFLRDITKLGKKGQVAPSRVKNDLVDDDEKDGSHTERASPFVLCSLSSPLSTITSTTTRLHTAQPVSEWLPEVCRQLKIENPSARCVWANGVLLFDTETLADHVPKEGETLRLEIRTKIGVEAPPSVDRNVLKESIHNANDLSHNDNNDDDDLFDEDEGKKSKHKHSKKSSRSSMHESTDLSESRRQRKSRTSDLSLSAAGFKMISSSPVRVSPSAIEQIRIAASSAEGADPSAEEMSPLNESSNQSIISIPEEETIKIAAWLKLLNIPLRKEEVLKRLEQVKLKKKATFGKSWDNRCLALTNKRLLLISIKHDKTSKNFGFELNSVNVSEKEEKEIEISNSELEQPLTLQFENSNLKNEWFECYNQQQQSQ